MTDHYLTDRHHAVKVAADGIAAIEALTKLWLREDELACAPGSKGDTATSGGGPSDPTHQTATKEQDRYKARDAVGRKLMKVVAELEDAVRHRKPRKARGACSCCQVETATDGWNQRCRDRGCDLCDGEGCPVECRACWRFRRKMGYHCTDDIHEQRPKANLCECGPDCCYACPDQAAEGRSISERCKKRRQRAGRAA